MFQKQTFKSASSIPSNNNEVLSFEQLVHQDDWVCDSERYRCHVCTRNFNSFRRKHHCRKCGEVVCRNCTLYKEAELPIIGRSKVRVCMSCILSHSHGQENPQSPPALPPRSTTSSHQSHREDAWVTNNAHSPTFTSDHGSEVIEMNRESSSELSYTLDFSWEHPWPKPPTVQNEAERLNVLRDYDILDTPPEEVFNILCDLASNAMKCPISAVSLIDEDRQWFKANCGLAQNEIPRTVSFCAHTIMDKEPLVVMDTEMDLRFKKNPLVTGAAHIRFYAGAPICAPSGHVLGTVFVFDTVPHREPSDIGTLEKLSNVAMKTIEDRKNEIAAPVENKTVWNRPVVSSAKVRQVPQVVESPHKQPVQEQPVFIPQTSEIVSQSVNIQHEEQALVTGQRMESMLMDLLCRTTETQQQLANQQGAMFQTLGQHTSQISQLAEAVARMESKLNEKNKI